ncbi:MAG: FAD-dependent oxidoreductase [Euryarchaeota archaeon]|nr:FAD-dependent oxidoreductase [Euryarchaeota archaeon]
MSSKKVVIVGGGAAGGTAAQFARKADREAQIAVLSREEHGQYSRCGLVYALSGVVESFDSLIEFGPGWFQERGIDYRTGVSATIIEPNSRRIDVLKGHNTENIFYDSLVIATGGVPKIPEIDGIHTTEGSAKDGIFVLRTLEDGKHIKERGATAKSAVIAGAGMIGVEAADALRHLGLNVTIVEAEGSVLPTMLDPDVAETVELRMRELGIVVKTGALVSSVNGARGVESVRVKRVADGATAEINCDMLVLAVGTAPAAKLAGSAGCAIGATGGIVIDDRCSTSVQNIFAAGDCSEYRDFITGVPSLCGMGHIAVQQGRVAGINAVGGDARLLPGLVTTRGISLPDMEVSATGPTTDQLKAAGIDVMASRVAVDDRVPYFPNSKLAVKLIARADGHALVGAQLVGSRGAHLRAAACAIAVAKGMRAEELARIEMCYLPPAAPPLDPLNVAAEFLAKRLEKR